MSTLTALEYWSLREETRAVIAEWAEALIGDQWRSVHTLELDGTSATFRGFVLGPNGRWKTHVDTEELLEEWTRTVELAAPFPAIVPRGEA